MNKTYYILLVLLLLSPLMLMAIPTHAQVKRVGIDVTKGRVKDIETKWGQTNLNWLIGNLTEAGYDVVLIEKITPETLKNLDALIIGKLYNEKSRFTDAEVEAIANWFKQGGKFLWVGADSDYTEPYLNPEDISFKAGEPNRILEAIGSHLRIDYMAVEDPENNAGAPYRVIANRTAGGINGEGPAAKLTSGVDRVLFHGPTGVVGFKDGEFVDPEEIFNENIFWLCRTGPHGAVVSHDGVPPKAYSVGYTGRLYLAIAEQLPVASDLFTIVYGKVIATGESLLGDRVILTPKYHGVTLQGATFVNNVFEWGTEVKAEPNMTGYAIIGVIVVIVVIGIAAFALRKR